MAYSHFFKYQQAGNDFIIFEEEASGSLPVDIKKLCHRKFGIGADGVILLKKENPSNFKMQIFNSDGNEVESCGNGICCSAKFLKDQNLIFSNSITLKLLNSVVDIFYKDNDILVQLGQPSNLQLNQKLLLNNQILTYHFVNTGVPHFVTFVDDIKGVDLEKLGPCIRNHTKFFPSGTNVNFACVKKEQKIMVRTYERGVESETLSCGTGACAVALISSIVYDLRGPIRIFHPGGLIEVNFQRNQSGFHNLSIIGKPKKIYSGQLSMKYNNGDTVC